MSVMRGRKPATVTNAPGSPSRPSTRAPSVASVTPGRRKAEDLPPPPPPPPPTSIPLHNKPEDETDEDERQLQWNTVMSGLKGFQKLVLPKKDEWEVVNEEFEGVTDERSLPGGFPQGGHYDPRMSFSRATASRRRLKRPPPLPSSSTESLPPVLKPVFCLHFPAPSIPTSEPSHRNVSSSTIRIRRESSVGAESRGSVNSINAKDEQGQDDVEFVDDALDDTSSIWSGTQRADSRFHQDGSYTAVIAGAPLDVPVTEVEKGEVGIVGGTIVIRGITREDEREALQNILSLLIYTIQTVLLELELLDAFRVERQHDAAPIPPAPPPKTDNHQNDEYEVRRSNSGKERKDGARAFFRRLGKGEMFGHLLGRRRGSSSGDQPGSPLVGTFPTASRSVSESLPVGLRNLPLTPSSATSSPLLHTASTRHMQNATDRFLLILEKLEAILPSTTPGLRVPMPPLLLRMKEEHQVRVDKAKQEIQDECPPSDGLPAGLGLTPLGKPTKDIVRGRALGYRLGGDVRAGLQALTPRLETFDGWARLQRLEVISCVGVEEPAPTSTTYITCHRPKLLSIPFFDQEKDQTLVEFVKSVEGTDDEMLGCSRAGCEVLARDHLRWWIHAEKKVIMRTERSAIEGEDIVDAWVECRKCGKGSLPRNLGKLALSFSWAKFLELVIYTDILIPTNLCAHKNSGDLVRCIRSSAVTLRFSVENISILDTRLPKLQVGPNVAKRKAGKEAVDAAVDGLMRQETREEQIDGIRNDVDKSFRGFEQRVDQLRKIASPEDNISEKEQTDLTKSELQKIDEAVKIRRAAVIELDILREEAIRVEKGLKDTISSSQALRLNDIRRQFSSQMNVLSAKLDTWRKKNKIDSPPGTPLWRPEYAAEKVHALPGSSILIREDEPSSVIAYTLSSVHYFNELAASGKAVSDDVPNTSSKVTDIGITADPPGESWVIEVKRRDSPRDLLSLRAISKKKSEISVVSAAGRLPMTLSPSAPAVALSHEQGKGEHKQGENLTDFVKSISKATAQDPILTMKARSPSMSESDKPPIVVPISVSPSTEIVSTPTSTITSNRASPRSPSHLSRRTLESGSNAPPSAFRPTRVVSPSLTTPITPNTPSSSKDGWSSVTSSFSNSFNQLLKLGTGAAESIGSLKVPMRGADRSLSSLIGPLSMMSNMDNSLNHFDDRPHIQFTYTLGDKLKLGCTVYYATAFDSLRRRCAIDKSIIMSLARSETWQAEGGKSKACFFKTKDGRYIVKELVSKWNVSDTQALLEIGPAYFEHLASTHNKATSLAKIVGFYTVRIHDLQNSTKRSLDLLVMENLFYKQTVERTYDLKGIEGRKIPKTAQGGGTLFDGEWLEAQQRNPILVYPHSKRALLEAISTDTRFLSSQSIMDYSLLLGLDKKKSELVVGLVDAIGSYSLFKTIESRSKQALNRGGEVTIIPPDQYRERFETALRGYFLACPDKWSRSRFPAPSTLPSIL
ncbi:hypothetical protein TREMEDRAFT_58763 [Tremella mesenterica DSM 1558]|uniref:uncharacterized protein n=1 Tax=Tremella mesenterica (strain ATCC 24925 / CBS 8224 / DSM 1558 / NBRC 9311 / NRRL Y-6157 / RJB 2259-6 / UBC 559-6) TaxID=578456 RepID=UPI0003F4A567|nr:uncharacterized protein TREMEDRAFT_58763 [Tremella mesenterica DSM 1558]EIW72592.1 hypothetical protein TREMEDRAFT_58763 [Tremella mesenterica DSM 1558]